MTGVDRLLARAGTPSFLVLLAAISAHHARPRRRRRPAGRRAGHHRGPDPGRLPGRHRAVHARPRQASPVAPELLHPDHGLHRARGAARPGRHRRRDASGTLEQVAISVVVQRAPRHGHRGLPQRGARQARPAGPHRGRGDERGPDDRGRPVHLLDADPQVRPGAQRLRGLAGAVRQHDPGRHARPPRSCCGWCRTGCGRPRSRSAPPSGRRSAGWSCRPPAPAW